MIQHLVRKERLVYVGGFKWLRKLRILWGGGFYTISPISVYRYIRLEAFIRGAFKGATLDKSFSEILQRMDPYNAPLLLPFLLTDLPSKRHLARATKSQCLQAWEAFCEVNDLEFISGVLQGESGEDEDLEAGYDDLAFMITQATNGGILPHEVLELPMQYFLTLLENLRHLKNISEGRPATCNKPSEQKLLAWKLHFMSLGIGVQ